MKNFDELKFEFEDDAYSDLWQASIHEAAHFVVCSCFAGDDFSGRLVVTRPYLQLGEGSGVHSPSSLRENKPALLDIAVAGAAADISISRRHPAVTSADDALRNHILTERDLREASQAADSDRVAIRRRLQFYIDNFNDDEMIKKIIRRVAQHFFIGSLLGKSVRYRSADRAIEIV